MESDFDGDVKTVVALIKTNKGYWQPVILVKNLMEDHGWTFDQAKAAVVAGWCQVYERDTEETIRGGIEKIKEMGWFERR